MSRNRLGANEPYARVYASAKDHPRHLMAGLAAEGLWKRAMSYCAEYLTDGELPAAWMQSQAPKKVIKAGEDAGLWAKDGAVYRLHDYLDHNRSRTQVETIREWDRNRKALHRDRELVAAVRERDGDACRYCGSSVNFNDKRGSLGGTYDHVIPRGPNVLENIVVACRRCNTEKNARTPDEAGMILIRLNPESIRESTPFQNGTQLRSGNRHG